MTPKEMEMWFKRRAESDQFVAEIFRDGIAGGQAILDFATDQVLKERERCAKIAENVEHITCNECLTDIFFGNYIAEAIRKKTEA